MQTKSLEPVYAIKPWPLNWFVTPTKPLTKPSGLPVPIFGGNWQKCGPHQSDNTTLHKYSGSCCGRAVLESTGQVADHSEKQCHAQGALSLKFLAWSSRQSPVGPSRALYCGVVFDSTNDFEETFSKYVVLTFFDSINDCKKLQFRDSKSFIRLCLEAWLEYTTTYSCLSSRCFNTEPTPSRFASVFILAGSSGVE